MDALVQNDLIFLSAASSGVGSRTSNPSLPTARTLVRISDCRKAAALPLRASPHENNDVKGDAPRHAEQFVLGVLRKTPKPTRWFLSLFNLSRDLGSTLSSNEEAFSLSTDGKGASSTERKQSQSTTFTSEKARLLRQELRSSETWHDFMYHSAIASRLAAPDS